MNEGAGEQGNRGIRNKEIKKPPDSPPDDLVFVYRDIRQFRYRNTGLLQYRNEPQNVHLHLRASCIREKYPSFVGKESLMSSIWSFRNKQELYMQ